jgi:hypothetical protein
LTTKKTSPEVVKCTLGLNGIKQYIRQAVKIGRDVSRSTRNLEWVEKEGDDEYL